LEWYWDKKKTSFNVCEILKLLNINIRTMISMPGPLKLNQVLSKQYDISGSQASYRWKCVYRHVDAGTVLGKCSLYVDVTSSHLGCSDGFVRELGGFNPEKDIADPPTED